jgi:GH18 family chitinase
MRLSYIFPLTLALVAFCGYAYNIDGAGSNVTYVGSPRHMLDAIQPTMDIEEQYIQAQTNENFDVGLISTEHQQCSAEKPCLDGSCCNANGKLHLRPCILAPTYDIQDNADIAQSTVNALAYRIAMLQRLAVSTVRTVQRRALSVPVVPTLASAEHPIPSVVTTRKLVCLHLARASLAIAEIPHHQLAATTAARLRVVLAIMKPGMFDITFDQFQPLILSRNSRRAPCDKKLPQDLDTAGFTHLVLAFATIDPQTYKIREMHPDEEAVYHDFVTRPDGIPKYLGIGGWEFSNPGPTRRTWSQMASTKENRHDFIESLGQFLTKWQFRGVDIHWQWPGAESRGGNPSVDTQNLVALMSELRQALDKIYGISIALPAQYEYLKFMDPKAIEPHVDWFNVLTYDLHGPWDAEVPAFGNKIRPHTDLNEIDKSLQFLWSSNVTSSKVNLGIANYGRGYTVADKSCMHSGCPFTGASRSGECTLLSGILSRCEIERRIKANNLSPTIISSGAGVKEITWDDQWIGYDDDETIQLKTQLAHNRCLGGTALWALSYGACKKNLFEPPIPVSATASLLVSTQSPSPSSILQVPSNGPAVSFSQSSKPSGTTQVPIESTKIPTMPTSKTFAMPPLQPSKGPSTQPISGPALSPTSSKGSFVLPSAIPSHVPDSGVSSITGFSSATSSSSSGLYSSSSFHSSATSKGSVIKETSWTVPSSASSSNPFSAPTSVLPPLPNGSGSQLLGSIGSSGRTSDSTAESFFFSVPASSRSRSVPVQVDPSQTSPILSSTNTPLQTSPNLPLVPSPSTVTSGSVQISPSSWSASSTVSGSGNSLPVSSSPWLVSPSTTITTKESPTPLVSLTSLSSARLSSRWPLSSPSAAVSTLSPLSASDTSSRALSSSPAATSTDSSSAPPQMITTVPPSITPSPPSLTAKPTTSTAIDNSPIPTGGASKCVPQDCIKECIVQRLLSFIAVKRPICVCVPKTCDGDDTDHEDHHNNDSDSDSDDNCSLLGCGKSTLPLFSENADILNRLRMDGSSLWYWMRRCISRFRYANAWAWLWYIRLQRSMSSLWWVSTFRASKTLVTSSS